MRFAICVAILIAAPFFVWFSTKFVVEYRARTVAESVIADVSEGLPTSDIENLAIELASYVHSVYTRPRPTEFESLLWQMRPYLTNRLLPQFARFQEGAIDALYSRGICDNAARTLVFLLNQTELSARQFNIVNKFGGGHSVVLFEFTDGRRSMLDPLYGVYPKLDGKMLSPAEARELMQRGEPGEKIWNPLSEEASISFYLQFGDAMFAPQGEGLVINVEVNLDDGQSLQLGEKNGQFVDVVRDGMAHGLTSYWGYIGHRYDRGWQRVMNFTQDTRVTIGLIDAPDSRFITTQISPTIRKNELIYEVVAGQSLRFTDGDAERDWFRFRSYQEVDFIRFEPLQESP